MEDSSSIDLAQLAKHLNLDAASLQNTVELLEEGNTVPFITRFRKDQTGGLDEQQIRTIQQELNRHKLLRERKESILKSIESRQQLTEDLKKKIQGAKTMRVLEDLYLPYKPKKKSLAYVARSRGLGPLADEVLGTTGAASNLEEVAARYVNAEKDLPDTASVLTGVRHVVAEYFCNQPELRSLVRRHMWQNGQLVSKKIEETNDEDEANEEDVTDSEDGQRDAQRDAQNDGQEDPPVEAGSTQVKSPDPNSSAAVDSDSQAETPAATDAATSPEPASASPAEASESPSTPESHDPSVNAQVSEQSETPTQEASSVDESVSTANTTAQDSQQDSQSAAAEDPTAVADAKAASSAKDKKKALAREQRRATRRRRRDRLVQSFKDYFDFKDPLGRLPHHRILAINRGERTKVLRVKVECAHWPKLLEQLQTKAFDASHPHAEFLAGCLQDALNRLLVPSIEREVRRELNDRAEEHAVAVFAKNLRKLLLQPPLSKHRVVAIDPGFRSGCKVVALDEFGKLLGHTFINLLSKDQQRDKGRQDLAAFIQEHKANTIAVGNGAACRETESLVGELLSNELHGTDVGYLIVNEAGTSVYSTSELGREELPDVDPTVRSAVSIGRRALDPLSELVKVDPASIGVGLYQHDVKAKHLRESLDDVVESCVNYVGVDVNSASPSLLRYVSGLNKMTANQIYKHREEHGPFKTREEIKAVSGVGESSYIQAAGFLKIKSGTNGLDGTWIHPESYLVAQRILAAIGCEVDDLATVKSSAASPSSMASATPEAPQSADASPAADDAPPTESVAPEASGDDTEEKQSSPEEVATAGQETADAPETAQEAPGAAEAAPSSDAPAAESTTSAPDGTAPDDTAPDDTAPDDTAPDRPDPNKPTLEEASADGSELLRKLSGVDVNRLAPQLGVGKLLLQDILTALARPGRDPREDLPSPPFRKGVLKLEDLKPGMELSGTVLNVVDFGAFVDIGLVDSGLIHVSRLADKYVSDPHDVVSVGDILRVWVVEVDSNRRRVSLTAIEPGTEKPKKEREPREARKPRGKQPPKGGKRRRDDRRGAQKGRSGGRSKEFHAKAKPKPVVPITKEMEDGKEPMRTFGDLKQLFDKKNKGES